MQNYEEWVQKCHNGTPSFDTCQCFKNEKIMWNCCTLVSNFVCDTNSSFRRKIFDPIFLDVDKRRRLPWSSAIAYSGWPLEKSLIGCLLYATDIRHCLRDQEHALSLSKWTRPFEVPLVTCFLGESYYVACAYDSNLTTPIASGRSILATRVGYCTSSFR